MTGRAFTNFTRPSWPSTGEPRPSPARCCGDMTGWPLSQWALVLRLSRQPHSCQADSTRHLERFTTGTARGPSRKDCRLPSMRYGLAVWRCPGWDAGCTGRGGYQRGRWWSCSDGGSRGGEIHARRVARRRHAELAPPELILFTPQRPQEGNGEALRTRSSVLAAVLAARG